tara:strand:+ start:1019 stop:1405 length:387 start_codon:yes stop_codon:yes gene_type:complete
MKLTKNFSKSEFECSCGCEMPKKVLDNIKILSKQLQAIRVITEQPIKINSAYRCAKHNESIGGVFNSQHVLGKAADIVVKEHTAEEVYELLEELMNHNTILQGGLGKYNSFTHMDFRGKKARWDFTKK